MGTFLKTLNPFENYWDEVSDFFDSVAGGFATESINQFIDRLMNRIRGDVEQTTDVVLDTADSTIDSLQTTIDSLQNAGLNLDPIVVDTTGNTQIRRRTPSPGSGN